MSTEFLQRNSPQDTIRLLQDELAETNAEVMLLTLELEKRVEERTAELRAAQEELKTRNAELLQRTAQLEAANKELEAFSYSVSHDLRAPIRRIDGFLYILVNDFGEGLNEEAKKLINRAVESAQEMGKLIEHLLGFSRMGRAALRKSTFDPNLLIEEIIRDMANDIEGRNIEWNIRQMPRIQGDFNLLKQVWVNLLSNAVKYTRPRNPAKIEVGCRETETTLEFYVKDNGVGFDMQYAHKLFGVFQRLHLAEEFEGTGIGLANVQQIISKHGGKVWADSKPGEGATFYFTLPA